jgi:hypothetical protein
MIEEGDASVGIALAGAVDVEGDGDVGFFGGAGNGGDAGGKFEISRFSVVCMLVTRYRGCTCGNPGQIL